MEESGSLKEIKRLNRLHIKQAVYRNAPITRAEIAKRLGLTLPTVTTNVADMLESGLLYEAPPQEWSAGPQGGRMPLVLDFRPEAACALGAELGPYGTTAVAVDARGNILLQNEMPPASDDYDTMLADVTEQLAALREKLGGRTPVGIGVGLPGFIETRRGLIRSSYRARWNGHALAADITERLGLSSVIDNNVRMRVSAEEMFSRAWRPELYAYFFISRGIACPVMMKTGVWTGYTAGAGEIGHTIVQPEGPVCPRCGHHGCLDSLASENAILRMCEDACRQGKAPILSRLCEGGPPDMSAVLTAQRQGDPAVTAILRQAIHYLGISLANTANLLSPGLVLVDGYLMRSAENQELLRQETSHYLYGLNSEEVRVEFLPFDSFRGAKGAAAQALKNFWLEL